MSKIVPKGDDRLDTSSILNQTIKSLAEGITGIAASDRKDLILSIGYLFQRMRSGRLLQILKEEWDSYRQEGRIKDDYMKSEQHQACLQEMLDFLDKDSPDEIRFSLLKKVFLTTATERISSRDSVLPQQYMKVCRNLSSGEVLVLQATYGIAKGGDWDRGNSAASAWLSKVAEKSGLKYPDLVEIHERNLIDKNLLTPRAYADRSGVQLRQHYRLTDLGYEVCDFIECYEKDKDT